MFRKLTRNRLFQNVIALYGLQIVNNLLPLVLVPYLARVLKPDAWGVLATAQSLAVFISLVVEYGFIFSATREVARHRNNPIRLSEVLAGVFGVRVFLALILFPVVWLIGSSYPGLQGYGGLVWSAYFWGVAMGSSLAWFFQGLEQLRTIVVVEVALKSVNAVLIFLLVKTPQHLAWVLLIQGIAAVFSVGIELMLASRHAVLRFPTRKLVKDTFVLGWNSFIYRSTLNTAASINIFVLGLFAPPQYVGYYASAERITRACVGMITPLYQSFFPRIANIAHKDLTEAAKLTRISLGLTGGVGLLGGITLYFGAAIWIRWLLGPAYEPSIEVMKVLAGLLPLVALSNVLGVQWMMAIGLDRIVNVIILLAGVVNIVLSFALAPTNAHLGIAWAVIAAELLAVISIYIYLKYRRLDPLTYKNPRK